MRRLESTRFAFSSHELDSLFFGKRVSPLASSDAGVKRWTRAGIRSELSLLSLKTRLDQSYKMQSPRKKKEHPA